jgi:fumarylacetoacetate (FAA) hydrolase
MKLVNFVIPTDEHRQIRLGVIAGNAVIDLQTAESWAQGARGLRPALPNLNVIAEPMMPFIAAGAGALDHARHILQALDGVDPLQHKAANRQRVAHPLDTIRLIAPTPLPMSLRDFYAFEQHVKAARASRGAEMIAQWYEIPVFYFGNHLAITSPDDPVRRPRSSRALDFELEIACVIGQRGKDIPAAEATRYIFGYLIMNDWSARDLQMQEMKVGLGPAKGKDFATSLGPWLVTPDELEDKCIERGDKGCVYDLSMTARLNGREVSRGNWKDIHYTFGQMIERASADVWLRPGDVIGSGTVGTGCLLELTQGQGPWLNPGDAVELEVERLGVLRNRVVE